MTTARTRNPGLRRVTCALAVLAAAVGVRQLVDVFLRATAPGWSGATVLFVETLVLTALYGAVAWCFVVVPARRRPAPPVSVRVVASRPAVVAGSATRQRHLTLVPTPTDR